MAHMFDLDPPRNLDRQPEYKEEVIRKKVKEKLEKLEKVVVKGYIKIIDVKFVEAIIYMFHVAKGAISVWFMMGPSRVLMIQCRLCGLYYPRPIL